MDNTLKIGLAQIAPVWLNKAKTIEKIIDTLHLAGKDNCELIVFGEALLPGYPFWLELTGGATFNSQIQKEIHAHYIRNAVQVEAGDLDTICAVAKQYSMSIYLGTIERAKNRGGHSLYCTLVYIDQNGVIKSTHRKLQPTYEERLTWSPGDGHGLQTHSLKQFTVGGLNCWENWMPLPRAALYAMGEDLHIAVWPGQYRNTHDITPFLAKEGRSFAVSVSSVMQRSDFPADTPHLDLILEKAPDILANGGSCIAAPDGSWVIEPVVNQEGVFSAVIDFNRVLEERQNFDPSGHYSRPDITKLIVNRKRQSILEIEE